MTDVTHVSHHHVRSAAEALLKQIRAIDGELAEVDQRRRELDRSRAGLANSLRALMASASERELDGLDLEDIADYPRKASLRLSESGRNLIDLLKADIGNIVRVEDLQRRLEESGEHVSQKYASNTLRKLYENGLIQRVGRGRYKVEERILSIPGLDPEDYK